MRWTRRGLVAAGALVMGYAVLGVLTDPDARPAGQALFLTAVLVAHDLVVLPVALAAGVLIGRWVPAAIRGAVRAAALVSVVVALTALPLVIGAGRRSDDPSALPLDYGRGLLLTLGAVWLATAAMVVIGHRRRRAPAPP